MENLLYRKEIWANERKTNQQNWFNKNSLKARRYISLSKEGLTSLAVDGDASNSLEKCSIINNYYNQRPTLVIDIGRLAQVGGLVIKTWQGKGQSKLFFCFEYSI